MQCRNVIRGGDFLLPLPSSPSSSYVLVATQNHKLFGPGDFSDKYSFLLGMGSFYSYELGFTFDTQTTSE